MGEKTGLLGVQSRGGGTTPPHRRTRTPLINTFIAGSMLAALIIYQLRNEFSYSHHIGKPKYQPQCPPQEVIGPKSRPDITSRNVETLFKSSAFKNLSIERLSGAVQIPTEDFDGMGPVGEDERWNIFYDLQKYFKETFPLL
jgi:Gly-Xaa carboxypeptidase